VPLFRKLTFVELLRVMGVARTATHAAGEMIVTEGEPSEWLYVSLAGKVKVVKKGHALVSLPPGSLFGEMGFLDANPRSADVQAEEDVRLLAIPRDGLLELMRTDRTLAVRVLWGLCRDSPTEGPV
jgi:CRP/FNR family cyclic AMP-dependent transcriptional regulator